MRNFTMKITAIIHAIALLSIISTSVYAQQVTLTFTGRDAVNHYVQLNRVAITNLTKSWQETIFWPDTVLTMQNGTGIEDYSENGGFALSQNNPNPFSRTTDVSLKVREEGLTQIEISDVNGQVVEKYDFSPQPGIHQFRITLSTAGTYIMIARQNGQSSSIKMVCYGGGGTNVIDYFGMVQTITYVLKSSTDNPFNFGDMMEYVGYATFNGNEVESQRISQAQGASQTFVLQFDVSQNQLPVLSTHAVNNITSTTATVGGTVTADGGAAVFDRGICYSINSTPTVSDNCVHIGQGTGSFSDELTGLFENTTYFVRAYAMNSVGMAYGNEVTFTTTTAIQLPTVITTAVSNVTQTSATCGGNVTSDGGATVTARGVCWSTLHNPTVNDSHTTDGSGTGSFTSNLSGLTASTTYYVRAYATNSVGTVYGDEVSFTTAQMPFTCGLSTLSDIDGNVYNTVQIGNQCWMKENLRTTHYSDNTAIGHGVSLSDNIPYYYYPDSSSYNVSTYGLLYNWKAVMRNTSSSNNNPSGVQGICPDGWHVPSESEWTQLTNYVSSQSQYVCGSNNSNIAKALASTTGWDNSTTTCAVGNTPENNNATGFSAMPAGGYFANGTLGSFGVRAYFWSTTETTSSRSYRFRLSSMYSNIIYGDNEKTGGLSVRCLRNENGSPTAQLPTIVTTAVSNITETSATCGGNVTSDGGATVTARGVCWSTSHNPTLSGSHTTDGSGTGSFSSSVTGLTAGATYYVRAYATNNEGTAYGNEVSFTAASTTSFVCGASTITDVDNNTYNTVQIGQQCWMKENLRTTKYADNTSISQGDSGSATVAYWYYPNNDASNKPTYGLLYNWKAVMRDSWSSNINPSGVQGVCPTGWHVPSNAEWTQLIEYVSSQSQYMCGNYDDYYHIIAKALASTTGWVSSTYQCTPGNVPSNNNATGFSALPAGDYSTIDSLNLGNYYDIGLWAFFWGSTSSSNDYAGAGALIYDDSEAHLYAIRNNWGLSVRCLRDGGCSSQTLPTVNTTVVTNIAGTSATSGGNVTSDGGAYVTARGVCWSSSHTPTIADAHTTDGSGTGSFTSSLTGLTAGITFYVRAYATNSIGTSYGDEVSFTTSSTTPFVCGSTVTDIDSNIYNTVQIGQQCWMKENLRTTKYADGTSITQGDSLSTTVALWYYPIGNASTIFPYGLLYNWKAVMRNSWPTNTIPSGVQGICPWGWHVPSQAEWNQLTDYVNSQSQYQCGSIDGYIAKALASTSGWIYSSENCAVGNNQSSNNATGFSAFPTGYYIHASYVDGYHDYEGFGQETFFWSTCVWTGEIVPGLELLSGYPNIYNSEYAGKSEGHPVRCLRDESGLSATMLPTVTTSAVNYMTETTASSGGNVTSNGASNVTARGICWSTSHNPTINDNHTNNGSGTGSFTGTITGLVSGNTYYVRAYATNSYGTAYGNEVSFVTGGSIVAGESTIILEAHDVWYDGSGYQLLLDADASAYGSIIPATGPLTSSGNADAATYAAFEYKIPQNADGSTYTTNAVFDGSITITIPAGTYDFCITNPTPGDRIWIASSEYGRQDNFVFQSGQIYHFYVDMGDGHDTVILNTTATQLPSVTTSAVSNISNATATCGGNVISDGGATVTARGICWSTSHNPTVSDNHTTDGSGTGSFTCNLTGLTANTTYYVRAYATNSVGTVYGEEVNFTTNNSSDNCNLLIENFESGIPSSWLSIDADNDGYNWQISSPGHNASNTCASSSSYDNDGGILYPDNWLITPQVTLPAAATLMFYVCSQDVNYAAEHYGIYISVTGSTAISSFTLLYEETIDANGGSRTQGAWKQKLVDLSAYTGNTVRIAFRHFNCYDQFYFNLDDVSIFYNCLGSPTQDGQPCTEATSVSDYDGNVYNTVQIGSQCWMKENLRTTHYANGTAIPLGNIDSYTNPYRYAPNDNTSNVTTYGYLYNWPAVMNGASSSSSTHSEVQGICPNGWHVPSDAEWSQLTTYVSSQSQHVCGNSNIQIAKAFASTTGWNNDNSFNTCPVGNNPSTNNTTGFTALPAGYYYYSCNDFGNNASFWSTTESSSSNAYGRDLYYNSACIHEFNGSKSYGSSVRCLRDESGSSTTQLPTVTTSAVSNITAITATGGGNVTSDGGATVTARGVCWSTSHNPTLSDSHTTDDSGTGSFTSNLTGLTANTTYYVRAYATNSVGTVYGDEVSFTTTPSTTSQDGQPCPNAATVTDVDGNIYNTVQIGQQCWMKENLKTTKYADGISISQGSSTSTTVAYWYYPSNNASNMSAYGLLYNWKAVMRNSSSSSANPSGVQGICPTGWHVPSNAEMAQLTDYVSSQSQYVCGNDSTQIAKALASTTGWNSHTNTCSVGNVPSDNNASGLSLTPAGCYWGTFGYLGSQSLLWTTTENSEDSENKADFWKASYNKAIINHSNDTKPHGYSVRCLRDISGSSTAQLPSVTTSAVSNITATMASCGGNVTSDGGATVTARGVCWSTSHNPTVSDSHTTDGSGTGSFTSNITGLTAGTTYYVRAYATNSVGTVYGDEVTFTTTSSTTSQDGQPCPNAATVTDVDGNTYNTVQIGQQCWMKENLRTTKYADGTTILQGWDDWNSDQIMARWCYPVETVHYYNTLGLYYNWYAVMRHPYHIGSDANPSGVQGICPNGWHIPSEAEWTQLTNYVSSQSEYVCDNNNIYIAKSLAAQTSWTSSSNNCAVGNTLYSNNATGFSAVPTEHPTYDYYANIFYQEAAFWSATKHTISNCCAYFFYLNYSSATAILSSSINEYGNNTNLTDFHSVRCLRDAGINASVNLPTVSTSFINVANGAVTCGGNITDDGGATVTAKGLCISTSPDPTINNNHSNNGSGTGNFSVIFQNTSGYYYYVRAYAQNSAGTVYGNQVSFKVDTYNACPTATTVTDYDGNVYNTVQIGDQCWMKENLRTTHYANGIGIQSGTNVSTGNDIFYMPRPISSPIYGYYYNWQTVMNSSTSSTDNPINVQGICPNGWHVPSYADWTQLSNYVSSQSEYVCGANTNNIARALASTNGWNYSSTSCAVGINTSSNNATGFGAFPAGYYATSNGYQYHGEKTLFWSNHSSGPWSVSLVYDEAQVFNGSNGNWRCLSVRCVKD